MNCQLTGKKLKQKYAADGDFFILKTKKDRTRTKTKKQKEWYVR